MSIRQGRAVTGIDAATLAAATGHPLVIDESGATQAYSFGIGTVNPGTYEVSVLGRTDGSTKTYHNVSTLTIVGSIFNDVFNVDVSALAAGLPVTLDAGAGSDTLNLNALTSDLDFHVDAQGSASNEYGSFSNFDRFTFALGGGTNSITTIGGNDIVNALHGGINAFDTGGGEDTITVIGGQNTIHAGAGNDVITVTGGTGIIDGGEGDDTISGQGNGTSIDGGDGIDSWSAVIPFHLTGTGSISISGNTGTISDGTTFTGIENLKFENPAGDSTFSLSGDFASSLRSLSFDGGKSGRVHAESIVSIDASSVGQAITVNLTKQYHMGHITLQSGNFSADFTRADQIFIIGSDFDDTFTLKENFIFPTWDGGGGIDTLNILLAYRPMLDDVRFVVGPDGHIDSNIGTFSNFERFNIFAGLNSYLVGGDLNDALAASGTLFGAGGDDVLSAWGTGNLLDGGAGNDRLIGNGADTASYQDASSGVTVAIIAGAQDTGGAGTDTLSGIGSLIGSDFADTLTGDNYANTIEGGGGDDTINGAGGSDTASYASAASGVIVDLSRAGPQDTVGAGIDTLSGFENLTGSAFDDVLTGDLGNNVIIGGDGIDRVIYANATSGVTVDLRITAAQATGGAGSDTLIGIEGIVGSSFADTLTGNFLDNTIEGGAGDDRLDGSTGYDIASYASAAAGVTVSLAITTAQNTGGAGRDTLANFEGLLGSDFNDVLTGDAGDNRLFGGAGDDSLTGARGADTLRGGDGIDTAVYTNGTWADYDVARAGDHYTITNRNSMEKDTLFDIELVRIGNSVFAIGDLVNAPPKAVADKVSGLVEAGASGPGVDTASGSVLSNDRDPNLAVPGLSETLTVTGAATGRNPAAFSAVHGDTSVDGRFGTLSIHADGSYDYVLDNSRVATDRLHAGQTGREIFSYEITDAHGATSSATLTFLIAGADESAAVPVHHDLLI